MDEPHLHKIFTGKLGISGNNTAETALFKEKRREQIWLWENGLDDDHSVYLKKAGEKDQPVFVYPIKHYTYWEQLFDRDDFVPGSMGENFSVLEMDEFTVCVGDVYLIAGAVVEVSEPLLPNWEFSRLHQIVDLAQHMQQTGKTGWYFRVLKEGYVERDTALELIERQFPEWTIQAVNEIIHFRKDDLRAADDLLACEKLGLTIQSLLNRRLRGQEVDETARLYGPNV